MIRTSSTRGYRGRRPDNATPEEIVAGAIEPARGRYPDANHAHPAQLLYEREAIRIGCQTLRRILATAVILLDGWADIVAEQRHAWTTGGGD